MTPQKYEGKRDPNGFPSHLVPPQQKNRSWCLQYSKSFDQEFTNGHGNILRYCMNDYTKYRQYSKGKQSIDAVKPMLSYPKHKGKNTMSWRNLDWNILPIIPTLVQQVINKVLAIQKDILITAVDPQSQNEQRYRRDQILTYMTNQNLIQQVQKEFGVMVENPIMEGMPMPANQQEVEMLMQMYPKDRYIMELYDQIEQTFNINNWKQIWFDVVTDLMETGVGGTRCDLDMSGAIVVRRVMPERIITNPIQQADFSDMTRIGEYIDMTISELRASVPRGTFTEEEYAKMASLTSGRPYTYGNQLQQYYNDYYRYPYDHEKILILDSEWFSTDNYAYVYAQSNVGNWTLTRKQPDWLDRVEVIDQSGKKIVGVSDDQYVEFYKQRGETRHVLREGIENLYGGKWIVGTDYVYDWGIKSNIMRSAKRLGACRSNYNLYTFFDSYMRRAETVADNIQLNWLQYQHHIAQSKPGGLKINKTALTSLSVGGQGGVVLNELDMLRMYTESGSYIYKNTDAAGRPLPYDPIQEMQGGISPAAQEHLNFIIQDIDFLRQILGLNQATDGSTPNPKLGKAIAEMLEQNTNTALGQVYHAYSKLFEETVRSIALLVPDAAMVKTDAKDEALGASSDQYFRANNDVTYREMGIKIEDGPTSEVRAQLRKYIELDVQQGVLSSDDAFMIEQEKNLMRAYWLLRMKKRENQERQQQMQQQNYQMEQEKNINSAIAAEQAKAQIQSGLIQQEMEKEAFTHQLKMEMEQAKMIGAMLQSKFEKGVELTMHEQALMERYAEAMLNSKTQIQVAKMRPKPTSKKRA